MITRWDELAGVIGHAWATALQVEGLAMSIRERDVVDDALGVVVAAIADLFEDGPHAFDRGAFVRAASSAATRAEKRGPADNTPRWPAPGAEVPWASRSSA